MSSDLQSGSFDNHCDMLTSVKRLLLNLPSVYGHTSLKAPDLIGICLQSTYIENLTTSYHLTAFLLVHDAITTYLNYCNSLLIALHPGLASL